MLFGDDQNQMDPADLRRLFVFFVLAIILYFTYNHFILEPQNKAIQVAAQQEALNIQKEAAIKALDSVESDEEITQLPREDVLEKAARIQIDNGQLFGSLSLTGGRIDDIGLYNYFKKADKEDNVTILSPKGTTFPRYIDYGWVPTDKTVPIPDEKTKWSVQGSPVLSPKTPVTLFWDNGAGLTFERKLEIDEDYMFTITQKVINKSEKKITLYPYGLISQTGTPKGMQSTWLLHEGPIGYIGDGLSEIKYKDLQKGHVEKQEANKGWIGITDKYWLTSLIPPQGQNIKYSFKYAGTRTNKNNFGRYQVDFVGSALILEPGQSGQVESHIFTGAKKVLLLNKYRDELNIPKLDLAVNFGWFWFLSKPFFYVLHYFGNLFGNMGFAIIALTALIRGGVFPLTNASYRSFAKMKKVGPQVAALREEYGDDKQKMQQELMKLYQSEGVNPMAGCFPILLQIPIFFALYKVLFVTIEIRHAPFIGWIQDLSAPDPTTIFNLFGIISWDPPSFLHIGVWPCVMLIAMIIQRKLNPPPQDQLQRDMMVYFPFLITYMLSRFASGLVIYWTFSAIIGVIQQMIIMRSLNVPIYLFGQEEEESKEKPAKKSDARAEKPKDILLEDNTPPKPIKPPKPKKKKKKK